MRIRDLFKRQPDTMIPERAKMATAASTDSDVSITFNNTNITYNGSISGFDYDAILRDKQNNIENLYKLADYFADADPIFSTGIKGVYVPFSLTEDFYLKGGNERIRQKYLEWYDRIHLNDKLESFFLQYYLFANVFFCVMPDGDIVTLPPHLCRISNVCVNGNPVVEFHARTIKTDLKRNSQTAYKKFIDDENIDQRLSGFPPEVTEGLKNNKDWVQLDPSTTFVWQAPKPGWNRYAVPVVARCLSPFAKKALISNYEDTLLNLSAASFVHASVGAPDNGNVVVDVPMLSAVETITKKAMAVGGALATTNDMVKYNVVQPDNDKMFDNDKYASVNEQILSGIGISTSAVSGSDTSTSFGASQISTKIISMRINSAKKTFCDLMTRINRAVNGIPYGLPRSNGEKIPEFCFPSTDLSKIDSFKESCLELWKLGVISNETLLDNYGIDYETERELKSREEKNGDSMIFIAPGKSLEDTSETDGNIGRPTMDEEERVGDPSHSETGRNPKPSAEEGSKAQE